MIKKNYGDANKTEVMMLRKECGEVESWLIKKFIIYVFFGCFRLSIEVLNAVVLKGIFQLLK